MKSAVTPTVEAGNGGYFGIIVIIHQPEFRLFGDDFPYSPMIPVRSQ